MGLGKYFTGRVASQPHLEYVLPKCSPTYITRKPSPMSLQVGSLSPLLAAAGFLSRQRVKASNELLQAALQGFGAF